MARQHSPLQQIKEAKQIARDHGMFVAEKRHGDTTRYLLYRCAEPHNVLIGTRGTPEALRRLVARCADFH